MPRLPQMGSLLQRVARGGLRPPTEPFPSQDALRGLVESRVGPQRMPQAPIPPQPVMTPPVAQAPQIPSMFQRTLQQSEELPPDIYNAIEPTGIKWNPERGVEPPAVIQTRGKAEAPSKAQLRVLVERLLGREVPVNEKLGGEERTRAIQEIMNKGTPETTVPFTNLIDMGRSEVTGMPVTNTPSGRALRLPVEDARVLALQNPERFKPGKFSNYGAGPVKETVDVPPGSPEDIIGGIGLQNRRFEPMFTKAMKEADEFLGRAETEASGYALPKPANVRIATAQAFKIYNKILKRGTLARQWDEIYQDALDSKPHIVAGMDPKEYFVEAYQKMTLARPKFQSRFKDEFKFIGGLGEQARKIIAPEAQLAERVKTPMEIPKEGEKTSFHKPVAEKELTGPGLEAESGKNELAESVKSSKTFKQFFDSLVKEAVKNKRNLTPMEIRVKWREFLEKGGKGEVKLDKGLPFLK